MEQGGGRAVGGRYQPVAVRWTFLLFCAEYLKTRREKEREKELLDSYLNTVNDRNNIVECLDEDRIR